ncbi:MAG TPA: hypothetical protein VHY20_10105 [Pirellulales bacterium]|jgi:hypothetical protein|nr:hypothetical protein [Pirellulales bacterium]
MSPLSALEILLLLSAGAFILPALVGGRARAIAGGVIGGVALAGLLVYMLSSQPIVAVDATDRALPVHAAADEHTAGWEAQAPGGIPLDPVQYQRERAEIERQWQEAELARRLWHTGSVAGAVFLWLAVATAYLKLDLQTAGRYRRQLRAGAAAAGLAGTLASAWAWTLG